MGFKQVVKNTRIFFLIHDQEHFFSFFFFFQLCGFKSLAMFFFKKISTNYTLKQPPIRNIRVFIQYGVNDVSFFTNNLATIVSRVMTNVARCLLFWNRWVRVGYMYTNQQGFSKIEEPVSTIDLKVLKNRRTKF